LLLPDIVILARPPNAKACSVVPIPTAPTVAMASEESANKNNYNDEHEASTLQLFLFALYMLSE